MPDHSTYRGREPREYRPVDAAKCAVRKGIGRAQVFARGGDGIGLRLGVRPDEVDHRRVEEVEDLAHGRGIDVAEHARSTESVELVDVDAELLALRARQGIE